MLGLPEVEVLSGFLLEYGHPPSDSKGSLPRFLSKLASKNQSADRQADRSAGSLRHFLLQRRHGGPANLHEQPDGWLLNELVFGVGEA